MLILAFAALAVASPLVAGRWPAELVLHRWRWAWLIWVALLIQIGLFSFGFAERIGPALHILTYVVAVVFLWVNRTVKGTLIVAAGAVSNGVTIALNGGTLPATAWAQHAAGIDSDAEFVNSGVVADPVLPWLGDVFAWPEPLPLANTFSVGDLLIVVGVAVVAWSGSRRIGAHRSHVGEPTAV
ncbi:DUF5317 domain-containing protein [Demequina capsici]|uniref:DUF5317 domain-containing protein n=1 Tax=Demequina capsici TaxID=3075620 RepID=A0AA96JAM5_9MICO|nr:MULTISPECIES: DUF5317 domain-containing protein [unclassified Demequina]WNM24341.1 DUF5317 domain-containing protein [Demequina sp. OYTSA14]WNM27163.1 DUF5317 domain-containing protein [Demequina sp. PMTSA13]